MNSLSKLWPVANRALKNSREAPRPRVLLIDDDVVFGRIMSELAKRANVSLFHWSTLQKKNSLELAHFDVIILDYELENITGYQFARHLRHYLQGMPILLVSAYSKFEEASWPEPVTQFLPKNAGPEKILETALHLHQAQPG